MKQIGAILSAMIIGTFAAIVLYAVALLISVSGVGL